MPDEKIRIDGKDYVFVDKDKNGVPDAFMEVREQLSLEELAEGEEVAAAAARH